MPSVPLRHLISAIGIAIAFIAAVAPPVGYAVTSYFAAADALEFKARLNAGRVARYVYTYGDMWRFHQVRLAELIELPGGADHVIHQHIYAAPDQLVLDNGIGVAGPVLSRRAPVVVSGAEVGWVELQSSLAPLLQRTGWLALFSTLFGFLSLFFLRSLPLRALEQTFVTLERREAELQAQNYRFETALDNMSQGLCMFDDAEAAGRLQPALRGDVRYLRRRTRKPGTALRRILDHRAASGPDRSRMSRRRCRAPVRDRSVQAEPSWYETVDLPDGRVIGICPTGTWTAAAGSPCTRTSPNARRARSSAMRTEAEAEQLRQQERAAEMANRAKTSFLAIMSHEIRTPMNARARPHQHAAESELDPEQRRTMLLAIHESGESLLRILNDILDYSKLDAGKLEFEQLAFSPLMLIDHLLSIVAGRGHEQRGWRCASKAIRACRPP